MQDFERKLIDWWKKANGVEKVAVGNIRIVKEKLGLTGEKIISQGIYEGNFSEWRTKDGKTAYTLIYDPLWDTSQVVCWIVRGKRNHAQLLQMWETFASIFFHPQKFKGKKVCWECGREFTFFDIETHSDKPWEAFGERISFWEDGYCGC